jgi:hypothetical protein
MERMGHLDLLELQDQLDLKDHTDLPELKDQLAIQEHQEKME